MIDTLDLKTAMLTRKSVREFHKEKIIPAATVYEILEMATTAPSSWNLQHWNFIIISDNEMKEKLFPIAYNQEQVASCSHLVVVLGDLEAYRNAEEVFSEQVRQGFMSDEVKKAQIEGILYAYNALPEKYGIQDAIRNSSLAAMQFMLAAKIKGIDSCPMLSFNEIELIKLLQIPSRYKPVLLVALGYGAKPPYETVRLPINRVIMKEY